MSVTDAAGADKSPVAGRFTTLSKDVFAGLVTSIMSVAYGLSFAALIFAPPLTPWIAYGIAATFLTTAISAAFVAGGAPCPSPSPDLTAPPSRSRRRWSWPCSDG